MKTVLEYMMARQLMMGMKMTWPPTQQQAQGEYRTLGDKVTRQKHRKGRIHYCVAQFNPTLHCKSQLNGEKVNSTLFPGLAQV